MFAEEELEELIFALIQQIGYDNNPPLKAIEPFLIVELGSDDCFDTSKQLAIWEQVSHLFTAEEIV